MDFAPNLTVENDRFDSAIKTILVTGEVIPPKPTKTIHTSTPNTSTPTSSSPIETSPVGCASVAAWSPITSVRRESAFPLFGRSP